jgi:hypothetical protein
LDNRHWPGLYLFGRDGQIVANAFRALHEGARRRDQFERHIRRLLARHPAPN